MIHETSLLATLSEDLTDLAESVTAAHRDALSARGQATRSLRDELTDLAAGQKTVAITCADGSRLVGSLAIVGLDYVRVDHDLDSWGLVAIFHIVTVAPV